MLNILLLLIFIIFLLSLFEEYLEKYNKYIYLGICIILVLCATFKEVGFDNDSENYEYYFINYDDPILEVGVEYSYLLLSQLFNSITNDVHIMFFFYGGLGVVLKTIAFKKLTDQWYLPIVVYMGNFYILHDLTQIRAAVVSGLFLLSIPFIAEGKKKMSFTLILISCFFHYSSLALIPAIFFNNKGMNVRERILWASIIPIGYILYLAHINVLTEIPIPYIGEKLELYQELNEKGIMGDEINVFNAVFIVGWLSYLYILIFYDTVVEFNKYIPILLRFMGIAILSFLSLASLPVLAFRVRELYGVVEIIMFTSIFYTIQPKWLAKSIVAIIGIVLFLINAFYAEILHPEV